jgi:hypothetical protein
MLGISFQTILQRRKTLKILIQTISERKKETRSEPFKDKEKLLDDFKILFVEFRSVPFGALEWAFPRLMEFRERCFFPWNNENRAKSIRRYFFSEWNFDGNPSLQASSGQMIRDQFCWCWGGGMEDLGYKFFLTSRKIAPVLVIKSEKIPNPNTEATYVLADAEVKNKTFLLVKFKYQSKPVFSQFKRRIDSIILALKTVYCTMYIHCTMYMPTFNNFRKIHRCTIFYRMCMYGIIPYIVQHI